MKITVFSKYRIEHYEATSVKSAAWIVADRQLAAKPAGWSYFLSTGLDGRVSIEYVNSKWKYQPAHSFTVCATSKTSNPNPVHVLHEPIHCAPAKIKKFVGRMVNVQYLSAIANSNCGWGRSLKLIGFENGCLKVRAGKSTEFEIHITRIADVRYA